MRADKLNKAAVERLFSEGVSACGRLIVVRALANSLSVSRFAAIAPRKTGCAVLRNRLKRRLRAAWTAERSGLPKGIDFAVIARRAVATIDFITLRQMLIQTASTAAREAIRNSPYAAD